MSWELKEGKIFREKDGNTIEVLTVDDNGLVSYRFEDSDKVYEEARPIVERRIIEEVK